METQRDETPRGMQLLALLVLIRIGAVAIL
jgi:hypothetical protein